MCSFPVWLAPTQAVMIPNVGEGDFYLLFVTDDSDAQGEWDEGNNVYATATRPTSFAHCCSRPYAPPCCGASSAAAGAGSC